MTLEQPVPGEAGKALLVEEGDVRVRKDGEWAVPTIHDIRLYLQERAPEVLKGGPDRGLWDTYHFLVVKSIIGAGGLAPCSTDIAKYTARLTNELMKQRERYGHVDTSESDPSA